MFETFYEVASYYRKMIQQPGEFISYSQARRLACDRILDGFRDSNDAYLHYVMFCGIQHNDILTFTPEGYPINSKIFRKAMQLKYDLSNPF